MSLEKDKLENRKLIAEIFYWTIAGLCLAGGFYFTYLKAPAPPAVVVQTAPPTTTGTIPPKKQSTTPKREKEPLSGWDLFIADLRAVFTSKQPIEERDLKYRRD